MATRVRYTVVDDLDGSTDDVGTYRFALEGVEYEIDLAAPNLERLRAALAPFITGGRRQPRHKTTTRHGRGRSTDAAVRAWWATHQQQLNLPAHRSHGPIPHQVREAYRAAH